MCIGLKEWCGDCDILIKQIITIPCSAGSRYPPGIDLRPTYEMQCNGSGCVDYCERTIQNCDKCYRVWRERKILHLRRTLEVLEHNQRELEQPYWPSEEDETGPDPLKARQARNNRLMRADTAIALQIVRRQFRQLQEQADDEMLVNLSNEVRTFEP